MKTGQLVDLLLEADPSREGEVCVGNEDIWYVEPKPAYWDGCLQRLIRDETKQGYNIVGAKYQGEGTKISIRTLSIEDAVFENPELPVSYECGNPDRRTELHHKVEQWREDGRKINVQVNNKISVEKPAKKFYPYIAHAPKMYVQFKDHGSFKHTDVTTLMTRVSVADQSTGYWYPVNYSKEDKVLQALISVNVLKYTNDYEDHVVKSDEWTNLVDALFVNTI